MSRERTVFAMRYVALVLAGLGAVTLAGVSLAQVGLWSDRGGVGLRPSIPQSAAVQHNPYGSLRTSSQDFELYRGVRELTRSGVASSEAYSGVAYSPSHRWGSSLEAGVMPESMATPRRYSLSGEIGTSLAKHQAVSIGLKLRHYDSWSAGEPYSALRRGNGYALAPSTTDSSYEVRLNYRYGESSSIGLAMGRDLETVTPGLDSPVNGDRQFMFTGQHSLSQNWGLTYDLLSDEPGLSMRVQGLRLGVRYRF